MGNWAEFRGKLFRIEYEHERVEIALSVHTFPTSSIENGIDQRKLRHRTSYALDPADD